MSTPKKQTKKKQKAHEPELFEKSYLPSEEEGKKPPYIFLALIAFVILTFIWKGMATKDADEAARSSVPNISQNEVAKPVDMMK